MKIKKLLFHNYKIFSDVVVNVNPECNIFVGDNDSGKSTILEAIQIVLSGKLNGFSFERQIKANIFNYQAREKFIEDLSDEKQTLEELPKIVIEAYFEDDGFSSDYKGTNNSLSEDCPGIRMSLEFDNIYSTPFKEMLSLKEIYDIPVEFYCVEWKDFKGEVIVYKSFPVKLSVIDTTQKDYSSAVNKFINTSVSDNLVDEEKISLARAYRKMRKDFNNNDSVENLNKRIKETIRLNDKRIKFGLKEEVVDAWRDNVSIDVEDIPFENIGFGTQNLIKMELVLKEETPKSSIILFEEPENNLSFGNMSKLISQINQDKSKQVFISTHSSFVANKLGLGNITILHRSRVQQLMEVDSDTMNYFKKLPGYNTVRFLLSQKVILVEGPTDELIIQRAYMDTYGRLPIEDGTDVIAVDALAFKRYCELAILVEKQLVIVTDNDGDINQHIIAKYNKYIDNKFIIINYEKNETLSTLEPSVLEANNDLKDFESLKLAISKNGSMVKKHKQEVLEFMINNKAEWGLRVFDSETSIKYPEYITNAIKK